MGSVAVHEAEGVVRMTFEKGRLKITVEQIDGFGKNPSLWVGNEEGMVKVASFGSEEKADMFCKQMAIIFFDADEEKLKLLGLCE